ncbi:MAG: PAS domain-containing protein, partial [Magnetococcales bacterium]|nr:PAS domain-containing protein [Magnetococcales bacterium]
MGRRKNKTTQPILEKGSRRLFGYLPDVVVTVDRQYRIVFMNRAMDGRTPKRMMGRDSALLFPRGFRAWYRRSISQLFQKFEVDRFQYSTDQSVWWEVSLLPIRRGRQVDEAMLLCSNITEKRVYQAQAIRHARLATIGVLAASIAHEISNPNSAILFNASTAARIWKEIQPVLEHYFQENGDFLLGGLSFAETQSTVPTLFAEMLHNSRRVEQIVENLKTLARQHEEMPESAQPTWPVVPISSQVDLHKTLQASIMILNHKIHHHTDCFEYVPHPECPTIPGNASQLEQVFINIILNALQALPSRERGVRVETVWQPGGEHVQVVVADQGEGIAAAHLPHLTEPFFTTRQASGGTGLGLSISNLIVRRHQGSLHFRSVPGEGSAVTITLPLRSVAGIMADGSCL